MITVLILAAVIYGILKLIISSQNGNEGNKGPEQWPER